MVAPRFQAGEIAWITGASSGIGLELAKKLAAEGVTVVLSARRAAELDEAAAQIQADGGAAHSLVADAADPDSIKQAARWIAKEAGRCDMVAPLAGAEYLMPLDGMSAARWNAVLSTHVVGALETVRGALAMLRNSGKRPGGQGRVALLASVAAIKGWPGQSAYAAAKGAQIAAVRSLAAELAPAGIRVNAAAAGMVRTPMYERMFARMPAEKRAQVEAAHPLGLGDPDAVADVLAFLLSSQSRWITGACIAVDGGLSIS
ncbi:MAG: SDR family oxidoreductase [Bryobacterales bacterium]|nr:SDR family oxidoreductase [Acidobacteriota bacterium]MCB9385063.1 SDR family oxidoreductase [Bryobacterales bacterium]